MTIAERRLRSEHRRLPRFDVLVLTSVVAAVALVVVLFSVLPLHPARHAATPPTTSSIPSGWVAHSAYGLQIAAPKAWSVQVFGQCPDGSKPGTLFIGTSQFVDNCPSYRSDTNQVDMFRSSTSAPSSGGSGGVTHEIRVHGLSVKSTRTYAGMVWVIPSKQVTLSGLGPKALSIMRTLAPATREAIPATGQVTGTEHAEAIIQVPVTGQVTVKMSASGKTTTVDVIDGQFWFLGRPGQYVLVGHAGDAPCPPVTVVLRSGENTNAPPIQCQGE